MAEETKNPVEEAEDKPAEETPIESKSEAAETEPEAAEEAAEPAAEAEEAKEEAPVEEKPLEESYRWIKPGMIVKVHQKIKEITPKGTERERIQVFEGTVIAQKGKDYNSATITVRKVSNGVGIERIFPLMMPTIDKIELVKQLRVRRAKIYFIRDRRKKGKKMKEVSS
jgi:large subunit ribosomal protein L19